MADRLSKGAWMAYKKLDEKSWSDRSEREKLEFMQKHGHDTRELLDHIHNELAERYLNGEITAREYEKAMSGTSTDSISVDEMKAQKYEQLQEQYFDGEITEEELEEEMDELFDTGDEFLDEETDDTPDTRSEAAFRFREAAEIIAYIGAVAVLLFLVAATKGIVIIPLLTLGIAALVAYTMAA